MIYNEELKISQYADNTSSIFNGSPDSLFTWDNRFFSKFSGLRITVQKPKWFRKAKKNQIKYFIITFNLVGIEFYEQLDEVTELNFYLQLPKVYFLIQQWNRRFLIPIGRVTVAKTLILSK